MPALGLLLAFVGHAGPAMGQSCGRADIAAAVEDMSKKLRKANSDNQPRLHQRMRELAKVRGWADADIEEKTLELLEDEQTRAQDEHASHLLGQ
ncbi:MAG: hypothetical protein ACREIB_14285, partial [Pseudomonadota bacterium]